MPENMPKRAENYLCFGKFKKSGSFGTGCLQKVFLNEPQVLNRGLRERIDVKRVDVFLGTYLSCRSTLGYDIYLFACYVFITSINSAYVSNYHV